MRWLILVLLCACAPLTELRVLVSVDDALRENASFVRVLAFSNGGLVSDQQEFVGPGSDFSSPGTIRIVSQNSAPFVVLTLSVMGNNNEELLTRDMTIPFVDGEIVEVAVTLSEDCTGSRCAEGFTCDAGECVATGQCLEEFRECEAGVQRCERGAWALQCEAL